MPCGGAGVAQSVDHLTLDLGPGHDLTVPEFDLHVCAVSTEPDSVSPSLSLSLSALFPLALSLSQNK